MDLKKVYSIMREICQLKRASNSPFIVLLPCRDRD